ncbi:MAG: aldehyde dehydrogenase family protein [Pseudobdellovibrionaceae bacterium]
MVFTYESFNPESLKICAQFEVLSDSELGQRILFLQGAQRIWVQTPLEERKRALRAMGGELRAHQTQLAELMTQELGKPLKEAQAELKKCIQSIEDFCDLVNPSHLVEREPLGLILGVMPWNFPVWQVIRSAVPCLLAGNAYLLKPSELVPQTSLLLAELMKKHLSVFEVGFLEHHQVSKLLESSDIQGFSFTGSTTVGRLLAQKAAYEMKPYVLELGGSDPYLVFEAADLALTVKSLVKARSQNNGQSCLAAKRWIIHEKLKKDFLTRVQAEWESYKIGEACQMETDLSVLAHPHFKEKTDAQIEYLFKKDKGVKLYERSVEKHPSRVAPQVIEVGTPSLFYQTEEIFAPVAMLSWFKTEEEALGLANATQYGLGAAVFTEDTDQASRVARGLQSGAVFINDFVKSDLKFAIGGRKFSGRGYEMGLLGLMEFTALKWVK